MTKHEFRTIRKALDLSAQRIATLLGLSDGRSIRYYEAGKQEVPGPVSRLMQLLDNNVIQPEDLEGLKD